MDQYISQARDCRIPFTISSSNTSLPRALIQWLAVYTVENFKNRFELDDPEKVNTGAAFIDCVRYAPHRMRSPRDQVMHIDKEVNDHNQLQTIARVNPIPKGKTRGYIVDYRTGIYKHARHCRDILIG